ncbi:hypothetical protein [Microbacterium sp. SORGH_AS_0862]|uniref:hypothetical protein n=1 Tax=Microbacterium sp. SORGH_AS_0862 TaxID=3041789 RepID=UPI0027D80982|nr:hypothetical protein [Microbacterium sp. SORGH_AS_0862]
MTVLLTVVVLAAVLSLEWWQTIVPPPEEFLSAIWTGLLLAGLGGFVFFTLKPRSETSPWYGAAYFIERATKDVGVGALDWLYSECIRTGADPVLLKSLLVVEVVQRPRWFRRIERLGVRLGLSRTSGAMQMASDQPLSDRASITLAAEAYAEVWSLRYQDNENYSRWAPDLGRLWPVATRHNGESAFADAVSQVADSLVYGAAGCHYTDSPDGGLVLELRRYPEKFALRGVSRSSKLFVLELGSPAQPRWRVENLAGTEDGRWRAWEVSISSGAERIAVCDLPSGRGTLVTLRDGLIQEGRPLDVRSLFSRGSQPVESTRDDASDPSDLAAPTVAGRTSRLQARIRLRSPLNRGARR